MFQRPKSEQRRLTMLALTFTEEEKTHPLVDIDKKLIAAPSGYDRVFLSFMAEALQESRRRDEEAYKQALASRRVGRGL